MFSGLRSLFHRDEIHSADSRQAVAQLPLPILSSDTMPVPVRTQVKRRSAPSRKPVSRLPAASQLRPYVKDWPPEQMAKAFLKWLQAPDLELDGLIRADFIKRLYDEFCLDAGVRQRPWNPVAKCFRELTTGEAKPYANFFIDGRAQWLRYYPIPGRAETGWDEWEAESESLPERRVA
jgi:hypothetical protein